VPEEESFCFDAYMKAIPLQCVILTTLRVFAQFICGAVKQEKHIFMKSPWLLHLKYKKCFGKCAGSKTKKLNVIVGLQTPLSKFLQGIYSRKK